MKKLIASLLFLSMSIVCLADSIHQKEIYMAFISGNMNQWATIVKGMEKDVHLQSTSQKLELAEYYYGMVGYYLGQKNEKVSRAIIVKADILLDQLLKTSPNNAKANALKGAFYGFKLSLDRLKIFTLGPESLKYIDKAYQLDPLDIQAVTDKANALMHAPKMFGGDKPEAIKLFQKSITLMEKSNQSTNNWFYLNTLVLLARAYLLTEQPEKARLVYEKALRKEPEFLWVKKKLYPELIKRKS